MEDIVIIYKLVTFILSSQTLISFMTNKLVYGSIKFWNSSAVKEINLYNELGIFIARLELKFSALKQLHEKWHTLCEKNDFFTTKSLKIKLGYKNEGNEKRGQYLPVSTIINYCFVT